MVYISKEKRASDFQKIWDDLRSLSFPIVVEGKRDTIALRRLGIDNKQINELKELYGIIFDDKYSFKYRIKNINTEKNPLVKKIVEFLKADNNRAILGPKNN